MLIKNTANPHATNRKPKVKKEESAPQQPKDWTVLMYIAGDNDLEPHAAHMMQQIEDKCGSTDKVNVLAQLGRMDQKALEKLYEEQGRKYKPTNIDGDWGGIRRFYVTQAGERSKDQENQILSKNLGQTDDKQMSKATTLADFLVYGMKNYPAKHYMVVLADHGGGWLGAFTSDASASGHDIMQPAEISQAFKIAETATGQKADVVDMVACLMATSEVGYQLKDRAKYLLASEEIGTTASFDYGPVIKNLTDASEKGKPISPKALVSDIVHHYDDKPEAFKTKSAIDLEKMDDVKDAVKSMVDRLGKSKAAPEELAAAIQKSQNFGITERRIYPFYDQMHDLYGVAQNLAASEDISDRSLKSAAKAVVEAVDSAVVDNLAHDYERLEKIGQGKTLDGKEKFTEYRQYEGTYDSHGLSIFAPLGAKWAEENPKLTEYKELDFVKETGWSDFITGLNTRLEEAKNKPADGKVVSRPADPEPARKRASKPPRSAMETAREATR